jgi:signal transduction histidine kinase
MDRQVRIEICDRGIGIPDDQLDLVMKKFVRARNASPGGSGLGLAIASRIVQAHGGTLRLTSAAGRGTTATVDLPAMGSYAEAHSGR